MAGRRPLVDKTIEKGLMVWSLIHGEREFSGYEIYDFLYDNGLIPSQIKSLRHESIGSRVAYWYKKEMLNIEYVRTDKTNKRKYWRIRRDNGE